MLSSYIQHSDTSMVGKQYPEAPTIAVESLDKVEMDFETVIEVGEGKRVYKASSVLN